MKECLRNRGLVVCHLGGMNESYWPSKCRKIEISGSFSRRGPNFQRRPNFQTQAFVENMRYAEYDDDDGYVPLGVTSL